MQALPYLFLVTIAWLISLATVALIRMIALRTGVVDKPCQERKIHTKPIPLLGGVGIYLAFAVCVLFLLNVSPIFGLTLTDTHVSLQHIIGIMIGGLFLMIGGVLDDIYTLNPLQQVLWPFLAILSVVLSGVGISIISNPFTGGFIQLGIWKDFLTIVWLFTTIYTTKFLDGLDGLVGGLTGIGSLVIALFSIFFFVNVPTATLSLILLGVFLGFLVFNFHPASIFLGESGSTFAGYMLGVLAILSGAKFAVALLIMGVPILDAAWVIFRRLIIEKRSPFIGDRKHFHFRLLDAGFSQRQAVCTIYLLAAVFGTTALFLQTTQKIVALGILLGCTFILGIFISRKKSRLAVH